MDSVSPTDLAGKIRRHDDLSHMRHKKTHDHLEEIEDDIEEVHEMCEEIDDIHHKVDHLKKMAMEAKEHYKHHYSSKGKDMGISETIALTGLGGGGYGGTAGCAAGGGGLIGGGIGGVIGGAIGSLFGRGFHGGGFDGGHRGGHCEREVGCLDPFILQKQGDIQYEIAKNSFDTTTAITGQLNDIMLQNCQNTSAILMAVKDAQYANTIATLTEGQKVLLNQNQLAMEAMKIELLERGRTGDRDRNDVQVTMVQNQNALQNQIMDERNQRRHDRNEFQLNSLFHAFNQSQNVAQQSGNKSVVIGSGTSGAATSTNTNNQV